MSDTKRMPLDAFLDEQSKAKAKFVATVEGDESKPDLVTVTPWVAGKGCLCKLAVKVPKSAIETVTPTGQSHHCCNKVLKVVEVHFKDGESISLNELFDQLLESAVSGHSHQDEPFPRQDDFQTGHRAFPPPRQGFQAGHGGFRPPQSLFWWPWEWWKVYHTAQCQNNLRNCQANCAFADYPETCNCNCENSFRICTGHGELVTCPDHL
jgi:hypothetical protein